MSRIVSKTTSGKRAASRDHHQRDKESKRRRRRRHSSTSDDAGRVYSKREVDSGSGRRSKAKKKKHHHRKEKERHKETKEQRKLRRDQHDSDSLKSTRDNKKIYVWRCSRKAYARVASNREFDCDVNPNHMNLTFPLKPISKYLNNRQQMVEEMFSCLTHEKLLDMLPDILQDVKTDELKRRCIEHIDLMSKKRIKRLLQGDTNNDISSSDTEDSDSESEPPVKPDCAIDIDEKKDSVVMASDTNITNKHVLDVLVSSGDDLDVDINQKTKIKKTDKRLPKTVESTAIDSILTSVIKTSQKSVSSKPPDSKDSVKLNGDKSLKREQSKHHHRHRRHQRKHHRRDDDKCEVKNSEIQSSPVRTAKDSGEAKSSTSHSEELLPIKQSREKCAIDSTVQPSAKTDTNRRISPKAELSKKLVHNKRRNSTPEVIEIDSSDKECGKTKAYQKGTKERTKEKKQVLKSQDLVENKVTISKNADIEDKVKKSKNEDFESKANKSKNADLEDKAKRSKKVIVEDMIKGSNNEIVKDKVKESKNELVKDKVKESIKNYTKEEKVRESKKRNSVNDKINISKKVDIIKNKAKETKNEIVVMEKNIKEIKNSCENHPEKFKDEKNTVDLKENIGKVSISGKNSDIDCKVTVDVDDRNCSMSQTQMVVAERDLLELQMRARAIKAMLNSNKARQTDSKTDH